MNNLLSERFDTIANRMQLACQRAGRDKHGVKLVAVSKLQPVKLVQELITNCNRTGMSVTLGENYVQEFKKKRQELKGEFQAHLIGPLQSNKVRDSVKIFDVIESVHRSDILELINKEAKRIEKVQPVLIQVNVSADPAKSGVAVSDLNKILALGISCLNVRILGLMTITEAYSQADGARADFIKLRELRDRYSSEYPNLKELSMGMSSDFEVAIEEGATIIRVGSALFGERV